jgi:hypothetical protein
MISCEATIKAAGELLSLQFEFKAGPRSLLQTPRSGTSRNKTNEMCFVIETLTDYFVSSALLRALKNTNLREERFPSPKS